MNEKINITLGSLFDGIGGFPYAASFYGVKTLWASEIVSSAISVTRRHFPDIEHLGDITKLKGGEVTPVDIITFGSPCQSFSIAGQRTGLEGKSGLFWEAIRIMREMREATNGKYPRYCVFENVPGILSANKGLDYKTVLEAFTETEIPLPPSGRWTNAGMVRGGRIDVAWIIHDAQHFGVAQRRRRLFLVCDFTGQRAAEILFKPKSLHRHFAQGSAARKRTAPDALGSIDGTEPDSSIKIVAAFMGGQSGAAGSIAYNEKKSPTLKSGAGGNMVPCVCEPQSAITVLNDQGGDSLTVEKTEISPTLRSEAHGNLPIVSIHEAYPINTQNILRQSVLGEDTGFGIGKNGDPAFTLQESRSHAVAFGINGEVAGTLDSSYYKGVGERCGIEREVVLCAATGQSNAEILRNLSATLNCNCEQPIVFIAIDQENTEIYGNLCHALSETEGKTGNNKPCAVMGVNQNAEGDIRTSETAYSLTTSSNASGRNAPLVCHLVCESGARLLCLTGMCNETDLCVVTREQTDPNLAVCGTLCAKSIAPNGMSNEIDLCILQQVQTYTHLGHGHYKQSDIAKTILKNIKCDSSDIVTYCLQGNMIGREDKNGPQGNGINEDVSFTLNTIDRHAVFSRQRSDEFQMNNVTSTQTARQSKDATDVVIDTFSLDCRNLYENEEISGTLNSKSTGGYSLNYQNPIRKGFIVRRLTPVECERLQGYPDGWTEYGYDGKPLCDTARYQALGNSVAIPCVAYVLSGIVDEFYNE